MFQWFDTVYQDTFLIKLVNMSITASLVILVLIGIRFFMRKAPKVYSYALWGIVLFRLLCPVSFSSEFSAFRLLTISESDAETGQEFSRPLDLNEYDTSGEIIENAQQIHQNYRPIYQPIVKDTILNGGKDSAETVDTETVGAKQATVSSEKRNPFFALYVIWASGVATLFFTNMVILWRLKQKTAASIQLQSRIYLCDEVEVPFCFGIFRPGIYLPSSLGEQEREYIILHERHHIKRLDHVMKLLAFLALCLHWFNPLVWIAFILAGKDMEMSCDEAVLKQMEEDIRAEYSTSLLHLATGKKVFLSTTLCFGEESPKQRIQNIMNYRKPSFWIVTIAVVGCLAATIVFASNPKKEQENIEQIGATEKESFFISEHLNTAELEEIDGFLKSLCSDVKLESFDQGHTDAVVWFALQKMLLEYNPSIQQDGEKYFVKQEIVEDYIRLYFDVPYGFLGRLPKELPTDAEEKAVVRDNQNICFYHLFPQENYCYEITYADKIMGKYVVGGQTWNASDVRSGKSMFYAILTKDSDSGNYRMNQYSIEGENAPFQDQNMGFLPDTYLGKYAIDLSQRREEEGENFSGKIDVDSGSYDRINQFLASFFTCPVLANFDQNNMYAAVVFAVQRMLRTDVSTLTFHQSADYYTMDDKSFEEYMKSYFCVPENFFSQMNQEANGYCAWRAGDQIVFEYRSMPWADGMEIDQIEKREDEVIVFGHNRLQSMEHSPFYEFAAVLVPLQDGEYRIKEFQISTEKQEKEKLSDEGTKDTESERQERLLAYYDLIHLAEVAVYDPQSDGENYDTYLDADGKLLFSSNLTGLYDGTKDIAHQNVGYLIWDINGDGVEELLFGENDTNPERTYDGIIYDLYTYRNHQLVHVFQGWNGNEYYLTEEGAIVRRWTSSAFEGGTEFYEYDGTKITLAEKIHYFITNEEKELISYASSEEEGMKSISETEEQEILDKYHFVYPTYNPIGPFWTRVGDVGGDGRDDYVIYTGRDGIYNHLALYLAGEGIIFEHEDPNMIDVDTVCNVDLDHDGMDEILLTMYPHVNSMPLEEYAVLKKAGDTWKKLEMYHTEESIAANSFPLSIFHGKEKYQAELSCKGLKKVIYFDLEPFYDYWKVLDEQTLANYYENEIAKHGAGYPIGNISAWGVWEIQLSDFEGQPCLIAIQGIEGYDKQDFWGQVHIYFDYSPDGKIRILDLQFFPEEIAKPNELVMAAYENFLSGNRSVLAETQESKWWIPDFTQEGLQYEYCCMDLDGDGIEELLVQLVDDPCGYNAVFHYDKGKIVCWNSDAMDMSDRDYPLQDGSMVHQYDFAGAQSYSVYRYRSDGERETVIELFVREEWIWGESPEPCPYYMINGEKVEKADFDKCLKESVTDKLVDREGWTQL